jgi:putative NIF3 family GTP cyclohydrolase 1 type 2
VHHPLYLKGTTSVAASTSKGKVVHDLIRANCGLLTAHTNADSPACGVSEAIAQALGLSEIRPLDPDFEESLDKIVVSVPIADAEALRAALAAAGAGAIGDYDAASFTTAQGEGRFRPLAGANPTVGSIGELEVVGEVRVEVIALRRLRGQIIAALVAAHPYQESAYEVIELADRPDSTRGSGRIGVLAEPTTVRQFADHAAAVFPATAAGLRVQGDPEKPVRTVALCGGSGDFLLDAARRAGADVYVTSDLRHHPASESAEDGGPALIDVAHWAAESLWLPVLRDRLLGEVEALSDDTVEVHISTINTDPWTFRV